MAKTTHVFVDHDGDRHEYVAGPVRRALGRLSCKLGRHLGVRCTVQTFVLREQCMRPGCDASHELHWAGQLGYSRRPDRFKQPGALQQS